MLEGFITRRKVAESPSRLYGLSNVMVSLSLSNRASLKILAFAASDSPKSLIKIAYHERNTVETKPMVTVESVSSRKSLGVKLLKALLN